ncbi:MAG: PrsW family intramembrane metalloprotease [Chloroflexi bacterium]|nr:PrsW family intramembrane metalloprotease [Chloroflexota bacterium]
MIPAAVLAVAIPLTFLYIVRWLDLYASSGVRWLLVCLGWGAVAFFAAFQVNTFAVRLVGYGLLVTVAAPIIEEFLKSLVLIYLVRRPNFTYFVDGAIYGFASGTAFAVLENLLYLSRASAEEGLFLALGRAFSTSLMHGSATALVGISLGRLRFGRGLSRVLSVPLGWGAAMVLHVIFNNVVSQGQGSLLGTVLAIVIGLGGAGLTAAFILWGLSEERRWLKETLGIGVGVSAREAAVVQQMSDLDLLLAPVEQRFGAEKRKTVEAFLKLQARLGIKQKALEMSPTPKLREELGAQVAAMRKEMDELRRGVGVYCMSYVRSILPPETEPVWSRLGQTLETARTPSGPSLWGALGEKMGDGGQGGRNDE